MLGPLQGLPPGNSQQQNQQVQQQQQQQSGQQGNIPPPPPQNGQDFTLSSVLHFLQTEWRRYERDRNEWEIERAEMRVRIRILAQCRVPHPSYLQARIALLEGERRSFENVKLDLMRRIKMLEYALRMERCVVLYMFAYGPTLSSPIRSKQLIQPTSQSNPPSKLAGIQSHATSSSQKDDVQSHKGDSGGSSPRSEGMLA